MQAKSAKYVTVANRIAKEYCGALAIGERLPRTAQLCDAYDVSHMTMQKALQCLVKKGLVTRVPRRGTLVARPVSLSSGPVRKTSRVLHVLIPHRWRSGQAMKALMERFAERDPGTSFEFTDVSADQWPEAAAQHRADLIFANEWQIQWFLRSPELREQVLPLRETPGLLLNEESWFPQVTKWCRDEEGRLMCLPVNFSPVVHCTNLSYPGGASGFNSDCSMDAFAAQLTERKVTQDGVQFYPLLFDNSANRWPIWVRAFGGEVFSSDGRQCLLDQPEAIEALSFVVRLLHKDRAGALPVAHGDDWLHGRNIFATARFLSSWVTYSFVHHGLPFPVQLGSLPHGRRRASHLRIDGLLIGRHCAHRAAVREFIHFLMLPENQLFLSENSDGFSCHRDFGALFAERMERRYPGFGWFLRSLDFAEPCMPSAPKKALQRINSALGLVWMGIEPPEKACPALAREVNLMLRENERA